MNKTSPTILAFDFGLCQIGVASGNNLTGTAQALTTFKAQDGTPRWEEIAKLIEEWQPGLLLVGLPLNMDDSESELSARARKFGRRLEGRFNTAVEYVDERLSSFEAKASLREQGHRGDYHDKPADSLAAQLILETYLNSA